MEEEGKGEKDEGGMREEDRGGDKILKELKPFHVGNT